MNKQQQDIHDRLTDYLKSQNKFADADTELIDLAAAVRAELDTLQAFVDSNGTTYEVVTRTGEVVHKHRPQHQQLVDARTRYLTILRDLGLTPAARAKVSQIDGEDSVLDVLLGAK